MSKSIKVLLIILLCLAAIGLGGAGGYYVYKITVKTEPAKTEKTKKEIKMAEVQITKDGFVPATISVSPGTTVTWANNDETAHRVASDPYPTNDGVKGFDSIDEIQKGDTYSFTFAEGGEFGYHDQAKPLELKGIVVVK